MQGVSDATKAGDLRGVNVTLEVFAGEDGETLLRHDVRGAHNPITRDGLPTVSLTALGDLDGRGGSELALGLRDRSQDFEVAAEEDVLQEWIVFSMTAGRPIAELQAPTPSDDTEGGQGAEGASDGGLDVAPDLVPLDPEGKGAPLPAPVAMLAVVVALAAVWRRR
jgi:hypothetical protein